MILSEKTTEKEQIFSDRKRTNILKTGEQQLIIFLLQKIPKSCTPNMMTAVGFFGSFIVFIAFILAITVNKYLLLIGIAGLTINWFGDSLDGRLAYYRKTPRKWYGFALDIVMDWISIALTGIGYFFYAADESKIFALLFVVLYGWSMLISLLRYKIAGIYRIDSGLLGPTELRVLIALILISEVMITGSITYLAALITITLFIINLVDTKKLLVLGNEHDRKKMEE